VTTKDLLAISGTSDTDVWAVGDQLVLHFDGSTWNDATPAAELFTGVVARAGEVYVASKDRLHRITPAGHEAQVLLGFVNRASSIGLAADGTLLFADSAGHALKGVWPNLSAQSTGSSKALRGAWLDAAAGTALLVGEGGTRLLWRK
jgi:sugar lactone lactonase YvrE